MSETPSSTRREDVTIEMPQPTAAPLILTFGLTLLAVGWATNWVFAVVGIVIFIAGLGVWITQLLPGRGHVFESIVEPAARALPVAPKIGTVAQLRTGMPGYRLRLPEKMHPISAGLKGGIVGGLVMPIPAMVYGLVSSHGVWYPVNLLAGTVLPGVEQLDPQAIERFDPTLLTVATVIHVTVSVAFGLLYGVLLPTLPAISRPLAWGALLMPLLWTAVSFVATGLVNPTVRELIDWPYFVVSQFAFGVSAAIVVMTLNPQRHMLSGLIGGIVGGLLMAVPAMLWGYLSGHGIWYPVNLLAVMVLPQEAGLSVPLLESFRSTWLVAATGFHAALSVSFGLLYGLLLRTLPRIPAPFAWGAMMMPLLWTATSYAMMGIVNPVLQQRVDWPWFIVSQFVYGLAAAVVVVRSEQVHIAPAGPGTRAEQ